VTDTMTDVVNPRKAAPDSVAAQLIAQARAEGVSLVGPGSPLAAWTKQVLETALEAELDEHLGYEHSDRDGKLGAETGNERNGTRAKTVHTELGPVRLEVPRIGTARSTRSWSASGSAGCHRSLIRLVTVPSTRPASCHHGILGRNR
jgi:putative transposase